MKRTGEIETIEIEQRWTQFWQDHKNYDVWWPRGILHNLSEFMPFAFDFDAVGKGLTVMYRESGVELPKNFDWPTAGEELPISEIRKLPIFQLTLALRAYAYYGLHLKTPSDFHGLSEILEGVDPDNMHRFLPIEWLVTDRPEGQEMKQTITAAIARRKLDYPAKGKGLSPDELAALARVNRKTIMNLIAPSSGSEVRINSSGKISLDDARRWLLTRSDFYPSIWQHQGDRTQQSAIESVFTGEPVFVPAADDDTWFSPIDSLVYAKPSCHQTNKQNRRKAYRVEDTDFDDYWSALDTLHRTELPRWRQLDTIGRAREKFGTRWIRKTRQELEALLQEMSDEQH